MSSIASASSMRSATSSRARPMFRGPNAISSRTVGENTWASEFWNTKPTRDRKPRENWASSRFSSVTSAPNTSYRPVSGYRSPSSSLSSVDLPQPFAPSNATFSPRSTVSDTLSSAGKRSRYAYDTLCTSMTDDTIDPQSCARRGETPDCEQHVHDPNAECRDGAGVSGVSTRHHRHVHFFGECVRLPEEGTGRRRDEGSPAGDVLVTGHGARLAGRVHVGDRAQQVEHVPVGHPEHEDEHTGN